MDATQIISFAEKLTSRRDELLGLGTEDLPPNREDAATVPDEDTQPLNEMTQVISSRNNKLRAQELEGIERALVRIENAPDDFGLCEECDEEIKIKRLELMPWAKFCVECQAEFGDEKRGHRRSHIRDYK